MMAGNALELAPRGDAVAFNTATARAIGFTVSVSPTHHAERLISLILAHRENGLEAQGAGGG